jgi:transposase
MARYKTIDTSPRFIAVDLERQLLPGTFEHALNYLVDHQLDLSRFDTRYKNDFTGASAYPPAMLLKVVLFAYSRGIVRSRDIERACREQVTFIALSGDTAPHFTTFAGFVSTLGAEIEPLFKEVLLICDRQGLIGREMFAIDGVKLPSNASKAKSGTRADFLRQAEKMEAAAKAMLARHRENDALPFEPDLAEKDARQIERLTREAAQMRQWLSANPDERRGAKGKVIKSNRTDPDSAKMATSKGVIQGYTGVAAVDDRTPDHRRGPGPRHRQRTGIADADGQGRRTAVYAGHIDHGGRRLPLRRQPQGAGRTRPAGTDRGQPDEEAR